MNNKAKPHPTLGRGNFRRLSKETGLEPRHISRVLRGLRGTSLKSAIALADAANVSLDEFRDYIEHRSVV